MTPEERAGGLADSIVRTSWTRYQLASAIAEAIRSAERAARAHERERCLKEALDRSTLWRNEEKRAPDRATANIAYERQNAANFIAAAIRAMPEETT